MNVLESVLSSQLESAYCLWGKLCLKSKQNPSMPTIVLVLEARLAAGHWGQQRE